MPYIITTTTDRWDCGCDHGTRVLTSRAVATLDAAQGAAAEIVLNVWDAHGDEGVLGEYAAPLNVAKTLPQSGGTVGPLPDGTVIEVAPIAETTLRNMVRHAMLSAPAEDAPLSEYLDAYNAAQEAPQHA